MGQILLGDRHFERVAWGCDFQDHICLGWSILTTFLLGVLLGVDLLGAVRQGCITMNRYVSLFKLWKTGKESYKII